MDLSHSVFSDDYYFVVGISALLTPELIDENYYIVDVEATDYLQSKHRLLTDRKIIAFISNDLDFYALQHLGNVTFIDRRSRQNEVLSCLLVDNSRFVYHVKYRLSAREREVLLCLREGLSAGEISQRLGMKIKTFYAHRRNLVNKLRVNNRIALQSNIARSESYKLNQEDDTGLQRREQ
nr:helix-turn-helix transcriptional regulator [uncultured Enterobacter sp.]